MIIISAIRLPVWRPIAITLTTVNDFKITVIVIPVQRPVPVQLRLLTITMLRHPSLIIIIMAMFGIVVGIVVVNIAITQTRLSENLDRRLH